MGDRLLDVSVIKRYNKRTASAGYVMGLNFKLDVGLYQLDPAGRFLSVIGKTTIVAKTPISDRLASINENFLALVGQRDFALAA